MDVWFAYTLIGAFALFQALPLSFAYRGKLSAWVITQAAFGVAMFALASIQSSGRGAWVLMAVTAIALVVTSVLSVLFAFVGNYRRARSARITNSEAV